MSVVKKELHAFKYALHGIKAFLIKEDHAKIHLMATITVVPLVFVLPTSAIEKAIILLILALVWGLEMGNSALEKTLDFMTSRYHPEIQYCKDVMAGAVLIATICSILIAMLILLPKIYTYVLQ